MVIFDHHQLLCVVFKRSLRSPCPTIDQYPDASPILLIKSPHFANNPLASHRIVVTNLMYPFSQQYYMVQIDHHLKRCYGGGRIEYRPYGGPPIHYSSFPVSFQALRWPTAIYTLSSNIDRPWKNRSKWETCGCRKCGPLSRRYTRLTGRHISSRPGQGNPSSVSIYWSSWSFEL